MVNCPAFLKKKEGFTLFELVIVVGVLAVLLVITLQAINPYGQLVKSRDARRKADLQKLKIPLEDYYNDHKCYPATLSCNPGDGLKPYWSKIPCDPLTGQNYDYQRPDCKTYRIYASLENEADPNIATAGCSEGCPLNQDYNYGVASSNAKL